MNIHHKYTGRKVTKGSETNTKASDMNELSYETSVTLLKTSET